MFKPGFKSQKEKAKEEEKKLDGMNQDFWDNVEELPLSEMRKRSTISFGKKKDHLQESLESMIRKKERLTSRFDEAIASKQKKIQELAVEEQEGPKFTVSAEDMELLRRVKMGNVNLQM